MNNVVLVGRLTSDPEVNVTETENKITYVTLAVTRNYKNADGIYDTDFIKCVLWNGIAVSTSEFCKCGDVVGIKGRLQSSNYKDENGKTHYCMEVVAERVTFLSSGKIEPEEDEKEEKTPKKSKPKKNSEQK